MSGQPGLINVAHARALAQAERERLGRRRCSECGGPLEGWAGECHSPQCSRSIAAESDLERDLEARDALDAGDVPAEGLE